ncbi:hypothetical protein EV127DRAFT_437488 [Xylaria flabelliformis]|nr:hypothetical protein EV127DRAFT_437488 [Xylaria flabelliformis]
MCGDHRPRNPLGGALAVLSPSPSATQNSIRTSLWPLCGRLIFHDLRGGGSTATHAMFMPHSPLLYADSIPVNMENCLVKIHETGDLTKPATESPLWATLSLKPVEHTGIQAMMYELERPVKMEVGDDGIIGRRVSIWIQQSTEPLSEGIAGFN